MIDFIILALLAVLVGASARYVIRAKKSGKKCIGCPESGCSDKAGSGCGCGCSGGCK